MSTEALIKATALNRYYGKYHAVKDVHLTIQKGEVLGLLGPNGAGKSSTMQMLTGNLSPSSGEIIINGVSLIDEPETAKSSIGYLPEQPPVYRDMTPREYLAYCAALHDVAKAQRKAVVDEAMDRCGLHAVPDQLIGNLSKGYQQRVGIAQAILHKPDVVILDEPTVGLDPIQIRQIRELIRELGNDHSVILSTHILPEVQAVCDRVQIIHQGQTVFADSFSAMAHSERASELIVSFSQSIDKNKLDSIDGVASVEALENNQFLLKGAKNESQQINPADIFKLAVANNWELTELTPKTETLEQIFMNLVHTDSDVHFGSDPDSYPVAKAEADAVWTNYE
ncbi:gliding motility-associated ABC transporter ATP-binding subunit GldA [Cocleimonas flava]|uniref:ABC-2 type transport system ATP-binding protein n=1 Tax=Cocleimonas flava TaxID=634765 RepID=A0A4R1F9A1_9GAMM|nr:ABC transporter ATP-binding protein [Cocleimonas flava]TCJ89344.1 ABC-2 type transport system ATP-binding protein [Cocleimonas flava]